MRACRLSGHARLLLTGRWLAVLAVTAGMTAAGVFPEAASAALRLPRAAPGPVGSIFQQAKLTAADAAAGDMFGYSVAVSGSTAVVGAPFSNSGTGAAYVFRRSGASWAQQAKLSAPGAAAGGEFGFSVALSRSTAVVSGNRAVYVFVRSGASWVQQARLTAPGAGRDGFGFSVAVSGSTAVVGAPNTSSDTGVAYVFRRSGASWARQAELTAADAAGGDGFGYSVAVSGSTAVVGAAGKNTDTGAAYVFRRSGARWAQQAELTATGAATDDEFGTSVALSGSTAVVGAPFGNSGTGAAYVFRRSGARWAQQAELTAADAAGGDFFGYSVALSRSTVLVGAFGKNTATGAAYVFRRSGARWAQQAELTAADGTARENFGYSVALSRSTAVAGAPPSEESDTHTGAAYVFARA